MPCLDMPLEKLKEYQGINPCPPDFDQYWDSALAELEPLDPQIELLPASFQSAIAECFHLYFTGVGGARIHAQYLRPKQLSGTYPALLKFHGYQGSAGDWSDKLTYVAAGFAVACLDCRGQGGLSEDCGGVKGNTVRGHIIRGLNDQPENLLFRQIYLDTVQLARLVMQMEEVDEQRVATWGGSQGGALALVCASLEPHIKRVVAHIPFLSDFQRVWEMDLAKDIYEELRMFFRKFDPMHERANEFFTKLGYIDIQHLAGRIRGRVMFVTGLMDVTCPPSTQFAAYNKITAPKQMLIYPDYGHEGNYPEYLDRVYAFLTELQG